jgi:phosphoribosylanthranilate isomerase
MALKTVVKVGVITNLSDARYCAGMGVDFLGFRVIAGQPNYIDAKAFQEIRGWVTGPQVVAEIYGIASAAELQLVIENYQPDYFELGLEDYQRVGANLTLPFILRLNEREELQSTSSKPAYLLLDGPRMLMSPFVGEFDILAGVTSLEEVRNMLERTGIAGISLQGTVEMRPGLKNFDALAEILEALEEE